MSRLTGVTARRWGYVSRRDCKVIFLTTRDQACSHRGFSLLISALFIAGPLWPVASTGLLVTDVSRSSTGVYQVREGCLLAFTGCRRDSLSP